MSLPKLIWNKSNYCIFGANFGDSGAHSIFIRRLDLGEVIFLWLNYTWGLRTLGKYTLPSSVCMEVVKICMKGG